MTGSSIGWGHNPFGHHQFGFGDWAEEMLWKNIPEFYRECDLSGPPGSRAQQPLRKFQNALKPLYQEIRTKWYQFPHLWDAIKVPIDQLAQLGYNVGIVDDPSKPEGLRRSSVLNASQLWINKGNDKGYQITAAFEGLLVDITPLWAKTCGRASTTLGTIGSTIDFFDLADAPLLSPRPVGPGTLHIKVRTEYGIVEHIYDDEQGGLFGVGNQTTGPLYRLDITPSTDVFERGETIRGLSSGTIATMRDFKNSYIVIDRISTLAGFTPGETLYGLTSGVTAVAGISAQLLAGPLRVRLDLTPVVGSFVVNDEVTGGTSGAIGIVHEAAGNTIYLETITAPGFTLGETITSGPNSAIISSMPAGSVDYISGVLTGHTVALEAGSIVESVVDLATTGPSYFLPAFDEVVGDLVPVDDVQTDRYARWPLTLYPVRIAGGLLMPGECRSHSLRLYFYPPTDTEIESFIDVVSRIQLVLERFRPIHVRFDKISFDGARAASQVWRTNSLLVDSAAASVWDAPVVGNQLAASQVWVSGPISATVAT